MLDAVLERVAAVLPVPPATNARERVADLVTAALATALGADAGAVAPRLLDEVARLQGRVAALEAAAAEHHAGVDDLNAELNAERAGRAALVDRSARLERQLFAARQQLVDGSEYLPVFAPTAHLTSEDMRDIPWTPYRRRGRPERTPSDTDAAGPDGDASDDEF